MQSTKKSNQMEPAFVSLTCPSNRRNIIAVYILWNNKLDLKYVGATSNLQRRVLNHRNGYSSNKRLQEHMREHGMDSFSILAYPLDDIDVAYEVERKLIDKLDTRNPAKGYNLAAGGKGGSWGISPSEETRELHRINSSMHRHTDESKALMSRIQQKIKRMGKDNPMYGRTHTPETREKIRRAHIGRTHSAATKAKMSLIRTGKTLSEETKRKISQANAGRVLSEETKRKISEGLKAMYQKKRDNASNS